MDDTSHLLRQFTRDRSEAAFRELVRRHSPVVYGAALRMLGGDRAAAEDVTQEVFTLLVRKAGTLGNVVLPAWLYRQACRRATNHVRAESRRRRRELVAAEMMHCSGPPPSVDTLDPEIDTALLALPTSDREALVLRYLEGQDYRKLGGAIGTSEEAARKRVTRAIEKLAAVLRSKGITTATAALGASLSQLGATPVPATVVSQIADRSWAAMPPAASPSWLKPALAGIAATSLVAGGTLAMNPPGSREFASSPATSSDPRPSHLRPISGSASLEDLIAEIKRTLAGPRHALTSLRLKVVLDRIEAGDLPAFFAIAETGLTRAEQAACYQPLFERWISIDADTALTFALYSEARRAVDEFSHTSLLNNVFEVWVRRNLAASRDWLLANWNDVGLAEKAFAGTLGEFLAMEIADTTFRTVGADAAIEFTNFLPEGPARWRVLRSLTGESSWKSAWMNVDQEKLIELQTAFQSMPDEKLGQQLSILLWKKLSESRADRIAGIEAKLGPQERFALELGRLGITRRSSGKNVRLAGGGYTVGSEPVNGLAESEDAAMKAGLAAGLSRRDVLLSIGTAVAQGADRAAALEWLDRHRDEVDFDALLEEQIRAAGAPATGWVQGNLPENQIIDWGSRLNDPEKRRVLCRAAFRRMLWRTEEEARKLAERPDYPADLRAEFHQILSETP